MTEREALLFDLDGVLVDSYAVWRALLRDVARRLGAGPISDEAFRACWGQGVQADCDRFYPGHSVEEVSGLYGQFFSDHLGELRVPEGVGALFRALRERGTATAVVTNTPNPLARDVVARSGALPDLVIGGTDVPRAKPAPDMLLRACRQLGVPPARALMLGDGAPDREAARAAGIFFVGLGIDGDARIERLGEVLALL